MDLIQNSKLKAFAPYVSLVLLVILFFNKMVFSDLILARGDTFLYFYPYWQIAADSLRAGQIPLWNPHIFMGAPFIANSQVGFFYPLNWPVWLLLDPPQAVKVSIVGHLIIASWGMYRLAADRLKLSLPATLFTAILFTLGGYVTAQVEHVNQLQGMAWLPWLLLIITTPVGVDATGSTSLPKGESGLRWRRPLRQVCAIAILFALQILAGHTQTVFLSGVACGLWLLAQAGLQGQTEDNLSLSPRGRLGGGLFPFATLTLGAIFALFLSAVQLLPTLELTHLSSRQGGLTTAEVLSFSWHPLIASQSLLPTVGQAGFTEYVAFIPISALFLSIWLIVLSWQDGWRKPQNNLILIPLILTVAGLFLALGRFNFISWYYSRLPGLDLFRVPARWLLLYTLGVSLLAGIGLDRIGRGRRQNMLWGLGAFVLLLLWNPISVFLKQWVPIGPETSLEFFNGLSLILITAELILFVIIWMWVHERHVSGNRNQIIPKWLILILAIGSLFISSRSLPYNRLTTPEAYTDLRPAGLRLQADAQQQIVPDRFLSLSEIFFDPGDQAEINTIYDGILDEQALYDYTISIKLKEIVSPNFPMVYGLASLDGFDGGILPLKSYSDLMAGTILPDAQVTTDGRLREHLEAIPAAEWLDRFNVRYVITDKVGDVWVNDVFFDRQHVAQLQPNEISAVGYLPDFTADSVQVLSEQPLSHVQADGGMFELIESAETPGLWTAILPEPTVLQTLEITAADQPAEVTAISLVNEAEAWFQSVVPGQYQLIHSGDVKIYENLDVWPRAFLIPAEAESLGNITTPLGDVKINAYSAEGLTLRTNSDSAAKLILTDAIYPGWHATLNGVSVEINEFEEVLRSIDIPAGEHDVSLSFQPESFQTGLRVSLMAILILLLGLATAFWRYKNDS